MNVLKWVMWGTIITLVLSVAFTYWFNLLDVKAFYGSMIVVFDFAVGYAYVVWAWGRDQEEEALKQTLPYCWNKAGQLLQSMPGGTSIEWRHGEGRKAEIRNYYDNTVKHSFRALFGISSRTRQPIVVIFDLDLEDIARYDAQPSPQVLDDPFFGFKPFYNPMAEGAMLSKALMARKGKGRRGRGSFNLGAFGQQDEGMGDMDNIADGIIGGDNDE